MPKMERIRITIDQSMIATMDAQTIIEPVWYSVNIYGNYQEYESSLQRFSGPQRLMLAVSWYAAEVNNGGHEQFYWNATGIVWEDAQKGFNEMGLPEVAAIIRESTIRMGGKPSFDRTERIHIIERQNPNFDDLDERFFNIDADIDAKMEDYIRAHPNDFLFDGDITRLALN